MPARPNNSSIEDVLAPSPSFVRSFLDASTAHLPQHICQNLNSFEGVIAYEHGEYGWLLWVPDDVDEHNVDGQVPDEVTALQKFARDLGCDYVLLDQDASKIDDLPTWEW